MQQNQPPVLNIKMVPAGVEVVLNALNQLPRGQVDPLWQQIYAQYAQQMDELQKAADAQPAAEASQVFEMPADEVLEVSAGGTD
jgi:hypothetical protein